MTYEFRLIVETSSLIDQAHTEESVAVALDRAWKDTDFVIPFGDYEKPVRVVAVLRREEVSG